MKISFKNIATLLCILMFLSIMLTGCDKGSKSAGQNDVGAEEKGTNTDVTSLEGSITYWSHNNPDFVDANKKFIEDFKEKYPKVKVSYQYFPYDAFLQKMKAAYSAKNESDIQQIFGSWAPSYTKHGLLSEVPAELAENAEQRFYSPTLAGYIYEGNLYGIPREFNIENGGVLYYKDRLKAAGYDEFPKTYDKLIDAAKKLTKYDEKGNIIFHGFDFVSSDNIPYTFLSFILQQGGSYWQEDNVHVNFLTNEAEQAMQALADLIIKHKVTDYKHTNNLAVDSYETFFKKQSAMCIRGPWTIAAGKNEFKVEDFEYGLMPSFTGDSMAFAAESGWGEVVSDRSKNKQLAWEFVQFITSKENNEYFNERTFTIPAEREVAESQEFLDKLPMLAPSIQVLPEGEPIGPVQDVDHFKEIINTHFLRVIDNKEDIKEALASIESETNTMIDQQLKQ